MNTDYTDEKELLQRLKEGDVNAYCQLYNKYHPALYDYVLRFVKIPEFAEDVLQEVFIKIWEIRERINPELSFNAYLYRISRNKVFKLFKKIVTDKKLRVQVAYQLAGTVEGADLKLQWKQYEQIVIAAIDQLPPKRQKVFRLCRQEGKRYDEVAEELGISRNTVKEHMVLAIKSIQEFIYLHYDIKLFLILFILNLL